MKVDKKKALKDAQELSEAHIRNAAEAQELIESATETVKALVEAGHSEGIIVEALQKQGFGKALPDGFIRNLVKETRRNPPLPPGESQPIGEGNPNPWEEWQSGNQGKDAD